MEPKKRYKTKQYDELLDYISSIPGDHFTVNDLYMHFSESEKPIGVTTIYRLLQRMVDEGIVTKYIVGPNDPACFEFHGEEPERKYDSEYHCKCEVCGKLIHVKCDKIKDIEKHLEEHHGFKVNPHRTVFYGVCENCKESINR